MRIPAAFVAVSVALISSLQAADQLADKTPAYYTQRYGEPVESDRKTEMSFYLAAALPRKVTASGHFLVLKFKAEALTVQVVYLWPEKTLAAVTYQRPGMWTPVQTQAIVMTYSEDWARIKTKGSTLAYRTSEATLALTGVNTLAVQTRAGSLLAERAE